MVMTPVLILIAIGISIMMINFYFERSQRKKEEELAERISLHEKKYGIPSDASLICCTSGIVSQTEMDGNWDVFVWRDTNTLSVCGTYYCSRVGKVKIPIENIQFYTRNGDYRIEMNVEGGGVNVGGAIVGGAIAGGVGALLAGRERITTTNKEIDDRNTYLYYIEKNKNKRMVFTSQGYKELLKLIPEKDISYIENKKIVESSKPQKDNNNVYKDIERLAELKEKGILTEDEFNQKKQLLLDKIQ